MYLVKIKGLESVPFVPSKRSLKNGFSNDIISLAKSENVLLENFHKISFRWDIETVAGKRYANSISTVEHENGTKEWYYWDMLHRDEDLPAVEYSNGDKEWWYHGKRHRQNGPAAIIGGKEYWYKYGDFEDK
ncbi:MAG: hypothetical protein WCG45_00380 [bacterium]